MSLTIDYTTLQVEIADYLGFTRTSGNWSATETARMDSVIKSGLRQVYYPNSFKPDIVHVWSFMRPKATINTTAAYTTGTIEVIAGVVTLTGGTWPSWAVEGELEQSSQTYTIASRDSDTQLTLDDLTVAITAGASYSLGRPTYDLPSGFGGSFEGELNYKPGESVLWPAIKLLSPELIRRKKQNYVQSDRPLYASVRPKAFDATAGQVWQIEFYPTPDAAYTLFGRYSVSPSMIDATDIYPLGGPEMAEVILESCLAVAEKRYVEDSTDHQEEFLRLLQAAIAHDANAFSPDFLGYNSDDSEIQGRLDQHAGEAIHSFNGVVYYD